MDSKYILKCISCVALNRQDTGTLPVICPNSNMPCFMLDPGKIQICGIKHSQMNPTDPGYGREKLDSIYMDTAAVKKMLAEYAALPADQKPTIKY